MKPISVSPTRLHKRASIIVGLGGVLLFTAAYASNPPPTVAMKAAEQAIAVADQARVPDVTSPELTEAREKLTEAQNAVNNKEMVLAERLAQESRVDAELAAAKFEAAKAQAVNDEIKRSTATLAQEMQRNSNSGVK